MIGALPALLAFYLRSQVEESPAWLEAREKKRREGTRREGWKVQQTISLVRSYLPSFLFLVVLMTAFTSFSHGTQDLYPTFLVKDHGFTAGSVGIVVVVANIGAILGGICCGAASEVLGRRKTIVMMSLLALPVVSLWAWSKSLPLLALGGFLMQFMVQGAWGVVPAHLNELSPGPVRAVFPGFAYQLGNLCSSRNSVFQVMFAAAFSGGLLRNALSWTVVVVAGLVALLTWLGPEKMGTELA